MGKVQTNMEIDEDLKNAAKAKGINFTETFTEALRLKLALPKGNTKDIQDTINSLLAQVDYLKSAEFAAQKKEQEVHERREWEKKQGDIRFIHSAWVRQLNGELKSEKYNVVLRAFCTKWNCTLDEAVALAMAKTEDEVKPMEGSQC